ncbi:hypothetical protein [Embleya sp. NPDC005971]|uniref:hypothetical protein n=1 Tax=Embleya sp. NPDC005971 TaxID=3156724 RepID=UPI00340F73A8
MESRWQTALRASIPDEVLAEMVSDARPEDGRWSQVEMLLCTNIDLLGQVLNVLVVANGGEAIDIKPIRRPGHVPAGGRRRAVETPDEKTARRAAMKARIDGTGSN